MINGRDLMALRILEPLAMLLIFGILIFPSMQTLRGTFGDAMRQNLPIFAAIFFVLGLVHPGLWLRGAIQRRHLEIQRAPPLHSGPSHLIR